MCIGVANAARVQILRAWDHLGECSELKYEVIKQLLSIICLALWDCGGKNAFCLCHVVIDNVDDD